MITVQTWPAPICISCQPPGTIAPIQTPRGFWSVSFFMISPDSDSAETDLSVTKAGRTWPSIAMTNASTRICRTTRQRLDPILSSTTRADGFVVVPADLEGYPIGAKVTVWFYDT